MLPHPRLKRDTVEVLSNINKLIILEPKIIEA